MPKIRVHAVARRRVAHNLQRLLHDSGLSLNGLALRSGVQRSGIYRILAGTSGTTVDLLGRFADALEVDVSQLLRKRRTSR